MDFDDLKALVASYLDQSDLTTLIPYWIQQGQAWLENEWNWPHMLQLEQTLAFTTGVASQPSGFKEFLGHPKVSNIPLTWQPQAAFLDLNSSESGDETYYTVIGTKVMIHPRTTVSATASYYAFTDELSAGDDDNIWTTTTRYSMVLLYASLLQTPIVLFEEQRRAVIKEQLNDFLGALWRSLNPSGKGAVKAVTPYKVV